MMIRFFTCIFAVLFSLGAEASLSALDIMAFSDTYECNDKFPHQSFCDSVEFKAWTPEEKAIVSAYLAKINDPRLEGILKTIKAAGITKIHRVSYSARWFNNPQFRRVEFVRSAEKAFLWVNPVTNVIGFTDSFFTGTPFMDPYAKVDRKQINVLHELIHNFDIATNHAYSMEAFEQAAGWTWNGKESVISSVDSEKVKAQFSTVMDLVKQKRTADAYALDRELGRSYGFPTLYAMTNQFECFAEVVAYSIFDPTAPMYYSKDLEKYLKTILTPNSR
ncbi:hypothetical protein B9G69_004480 [Bdellovibrio sp. SKB1291214]|uniref:hypothetical protein n=1 Tax=Bdellovibrio sp. SKB1291214 TaxID=1732569 RepID=UPI0020CF6CF4|nr:hypothetical protein [Bdellovibrio sp. SKB1291214]UYL09831.1 hypothetical protein B9G69_004480 [Bdellovibrio sp. SKB1291214]